MKILIRLVFTLLNEKIIAFNNSPTISNLLETQNAWKNAFLKWKEIEVFNITPIQNTFLNSRMHTWPVNDTEIENRIITATIQNSLDVNGIGATIKGYGTIEYLLFHSTDSIIIEEFTITQNITERKNFLHAIAQNINLLAIELQEIWINLENEFKTNLETGVNGNFNRIVNVTIAGLERVQVLKLEEFLNNITDRTLFEAHYSELSKDAIRSNLDAIYLTYTGDFNNQEGYGLEEYTNLILKREDIDSEIQTAFNDAYNSLSNINDPIENTIASNITSIEILKEDIQDIVRLLKVDFSSAANIVITFNDLDGD